LKAETGIKERQRGFCDQTQHDHAHDKATENYKHSSSNWKRMGKEQSKLSTTLTSCPAAGTVKGEIPIEKLLRVQRTIVKEYPFLESVYESMLLADNTLPDCPIVFANEHV